MTHSFLIMAHAYPQHLARIINALSADNHYVFINIDKKAVVGEIIDSVSGKDRVFFLRDDERMSVQHGCYSQVECTLRLLNKAIRTVPHCDYFHLMSGQDYMCVSPSEFDAFFEVHAGESFMHFDSESEIALWRNTKYRNRICTWHFGDLFPRKNLAVRVVKKSLQVVCDILVKRPMMDDVVGGWSWFSWHKSVARFVMTVLEEQPDYFRRYHHTHCCDELVFHTLLYSRLSALKIHRDNALRFIEWHPKRPCASLPLVLEATEYDEIAASGAFICRKVHPDTSSTLLDKLDKRID